MKGKPSFNNYNLSDNKNSPSDLTKPLDNTSGILYSPDEYSIPEREVKTWCSFMERGFRASRNMMNKQSGTHTEATADVIGEETSKK